MRRVGAHPNVWGHCLRALVAKGWAIRIELPSITELPESDDMVAQLYSSKTYSAQRTNVRVYGDNPLEILGLVCLSDHVGEVEDEPYWWRVPGPEMEEQLFEAAVECALSEWREVDPGKWEVAIRQALADPQPHDYLGVSRTFLEKILRQPPFASGSGT